MKLSTVMGGSGGVGRVRYDQKLKSKSKQGIDEGISIRHEDARALYRWPVEVLHSASTQGICVQETERVV